MYSWPGVKFLLNGSPPSIMAGTPCAITSRSVAQMATASMRVSTSPRRGTGTGFSASLISPGCVRTQAFILSGTGYSGLVFTPSGLYMRSSCLMGQNYMFRGGDASQRLICRREPTIKTASSDVNASDLLWCSRASARVGVHCRQPASHLTCGDRKRDFSGVRQEKRYEHAAEFC